ncbi:MAG: TetR/AcrR family transcriptional regulator, partial [Sphingobacteriales bacterium]
FSHFGFSKTTLTEIADDLSMSRQLFLYYFHDKNNLIAAVIERLIGEFHGITETRLLEARTVADGLTGLLDVRKEFILKYSLLAIQAERLDVAKNPHLQTIITRSFRKSMGLVSGLLDRGIAAGEVRELNTRKTAKTILQAIAAYDHCLSFKNGLPQKDALENIHRSKKELITLIVNGLRK